MMEEKEKPRILLVEDDTNLGTVIRDFLKLKGFDIVLMNDGEKGFQSFQDNAFDCCVLDVMLPKMDGMTLAKKIRQIDHQIPILFLTARSMDEDKVAGFELGADDYITKPFNIEELVMRINVFLRRSKALDDSDTHQIFEIGDYTFDYENLNLTYKEEHKTLTQREADILRLLALKQGNVIKREDILMKIWGKDDYFAGRSLDVFLSKLRKYLKSDSRIDIQNYHSVGFRLIVRD